MTADSSSSRSVPTTPVCVLGLGLIGGSLLRVLHDAGHETFGYNRSSATVEAATADGYQASTDLVATLRRAAETGAVVVLATPVTTIEPILSAIAEHAPGALLTDVISVKQEVEKVIARAHPGARYVGGHPMAGTSRSGWSATDPTLFQGAMWAVTTTDHTDADDWLAVASIARLAGSRVVPVAPDAHDRAVAAISHMPHLTAAATAAVGAGESDLALRLAAGSFRDGTRVAGTAPALQRAMIEANGIAVLNVLSETIDRLIAARDELRDHGTAEILVDDGHRARVAYERLHDGEPEPISGVTIGEPGWQEELRRQAHQGRVWVG
ncbi:MULTISPECIES: prephenate dehydrogenase [Gordonia]|uniref:Prephenate dehydrogenase n=1 Tax=Gordonia alkanivorans CGMCC 6845 TaxID=1423140 RepID=W9DKX8_9ACTN|nr:MULTISPECIES: prephenate dehydrogenase [Gordonia]AZZ80251.1 prephenate dehydrogenase [Gordonia alkanivorans]ETA07791.1 prephenate dehydrogenase [Gordonia alkanivorans CGMCC 6845]MDH3013019.1 prephenate dehydrogenase [Gordonia alkanivorans]MDH3050059.1 prephenate dehydrogenase [Gordonia alkanivorans]MDJ0029301.1 prephenate dehydrogenase [Gordonia alkanivorans]